MKWSSTSPRTRGIPAALAASLLLGTSLCAGDVPFIRGVRIGDFDSDPMSTAIAILRYLFWGGERTPNCVEAADVNDDGAVNLTDAVYLLNYRYVGGPPPPAPYPRCGLDSTPDTLGCESYAWCSLTNYGVSFEADAIVFVLDRSLYMTDNGEFSIARREVLRLVLSALPPGTEYGVVFFGGKEKAYPGPDSLVLVDDAGEDFANWMLDSGPTDDPLACPASGLLAALKLLDGAAGKSRAIFYVGTGRGVCGNDAEAAYLEQTLAQVTAANAGAAVINAVQLVQFTDEGEKFLRALAAQNGGAFVQITR